MTDSHDRREQLSVPMKPELRRAIDRAASAEDRPAASWVRRLAYFCSAPKSITLGTPNLLVWWGVMHKFKLGQRLFPSRSDELSAPDGAYVVIKRLPIRHGEFEYQIKSLTEPDERVVRESQLRPNPWGYNLGRPAEY
jgi:hypothetical protein